MNFYPFHIGDYLAHTAHLEPLEDLAYRRMIDLYYLREGMLPIAPDEVAKLIRMRDQVETVNAVLSEFFTVTESGWSHSRCDYEISEAQSKRSKAKESAAQRWESERKANAMRTHTEGNAPNPITNTNSEPKSLSDYPLEFENAWSAYPSRPGASKKAAFKAWSARLSAGIGHQIMLSGAVRYAEYCKAMGTDPQYIKQPSTFFGPGDHFLADWTVRKVEHLKPEQSIVVPAKHQPCVCCGSIGVKRIGSSWYCADHHQYSEMRA